MDTQPVVYIVDDDVSVLRALKRLIRSMGFSVETFATAEDFLQSRYHQEKGCLILDIQLPGMDGFSLQQSLVASGCKIPIIFITAHDVTELRTRALQASAGLLRKPVDDQALLNSINTALGLSAARKPESQDPRGR